MACATNLALDGIVFRVPRGRRRQGRLRLVGLRLSESPAERTRERSSYLTEDMVGPPYDADEMYGWAKLMAEMTLRAYAAEDRP